MKLVLENEAIDCAQLLRALIRHGFRSVNNTREYFVLQSQRLQNLLRYTRSTSRILTRDQRPSQSGAL